MTATTVERVPPIEELNRAGFEAFTGAYDAAERILWQLEHLVDEHGDVCPPELLPTAADIGAVWAFANGLRSMGGQIVETGDKVMSLLAELEGMRADAAARAERGTS